MTRQELLTAYFTIVSKEVTRFFRIWPQTFLPNIITTSLYFLIFGKIIGAQINPISGHPYIKYIMPGLVMMAIITSSYSNTVASFFSAKFQKSIDELIVSPTPHSIIIIGYISGGVIRGLINGILVLIVSMFFVDIISIHSITILLLVSILASIIFANIGFINGLYAKNFDDISWVPSFVLTPLSYLGGIFYSIKQLPNIWYKISLLNPIFYCVDIMRFSVLGIQTLNVWLMISVSILIISMLYMLTIRIMTKKLLK